MTTRFALPLAVILLPLITACSGQAAPVTTIPTPSPTPTTFTAAGSLQVEADLEEIDDQDSTCPQSTYPDIALGTSVTVTDAEGKVVGLGNLDYPTVDGTFKSSGNLFPLKCKYGFVVTDVPLGSAFYGFEVAHRGVVRFPAATATAPSLTLGS